MANHSLQACGINDFLSIELPERELILDPWLSSQGLAMIHAPRGIGKTHVSLGIAYAVSTGGEFLGWHAPKAKGVLFIDGEMPANLLQERLKAIAGPNLNDDTPLFLVNPDLQNGSIPDIATKEGQSAINKILHEHPEIELVILDNLSTLVRSGVENEAQSWQILQDWLLALRSANISVIFIHHSGKNGSQRGTSRREDVLDTVISLRRTPDYSPNRGAEFEVHFEKTRGLCGEAVRSFTARLVEDSNGEQAWELNGCKSDSVEQVLSLHAKGFNQTQIAEKLNMHKSKISRMFKNARESGLMPQESLLN